MRNLLLLILILVFSTSFCQAAKISLDIPDGEKARVYKAVSNYYGYQKKIRQVSFVDQVINGETVSVKQVAKIDNPQSRKDFVEDKMIEHLMDIVANQEGSEAAEIERVKAETKARTDILITK